MSMIELVMEALNPGIGSKRYYIRFGRIPPNERSRIYRGDEIIGEELGVSCYDAAFIDGEWRIIYPNPCKECTVDTLHGLILGCCGRNKFDDNDAYLLTGDKVGVGSDGEPLIRNVKVVANITKQFKYIEPIRTEFPQVDTENILETVDKDRVAKMIYKMRMKRDAVDDEILKLENHYVDLCRDDDINYEQGRGINRAPIVTELEERINRLLCEQKPE